MMYRFVMLFFSLCSVGTTVLGLPISTSMQISRRDGETHYGNGTYYDTGTGACGYTDSNNDPVVAISHLIYGNGENCNQWIQITNQANGKAQYGKMRDKCEGCTEYNLDLSPSLFESLGADLSQGVIHIDWQFMDKDFSP